MDVFSQGKIIKTKSRFLIVVCSKTSFSPHSTTEQPW